MVARRSPTVAAEAKSSLKEVSMCHQVTCPQCANPTWSGCGNHVEQSLARCCAQRSTHLRSERRRALRRHVDAVLPRTSRERLR